MDKLCSKSREIFFSGLCSVLKMPLIINLSSLLEILSPLSFSDVASLQDLASFEKSFQKLDELLEQSQIFLALIGC